MAKTWNTPTVVPIDTLPTARRTNPDHLAFYEDVTRRLEQTPAKEAVRYGFADYKIAQKHVDFVRNRASKYLGKNKVKLTLSAAGGVWVYAYRGPEW